MSLNGAAMFIAMVIIIILFEIILTITKGSAGMSFITPTNLFSILRQQAYTGIIAFGLTLVMITGNIDLSVGSMLTFLCCVCAKIMMGTDNGLLGIFGTIAAGAICGLVNGVLVSYVKLNSFITTLAPAPSLRRWHCGFPPAPFWLFRITAILCSRQSALPPLDRYIFSLSGL